MKWLYSNLDYFSCLDMTDKLGIKLVQAEIVSNNLQEEMKR